jgi:hypothetical protein
MGVARSLPVGSLRNLDSQEVLFFQFMPDSLEENITVNWGRALPLFGTSEVSHYSGTMSERIQLGLIYTDVGVTKNAAGQFAQGPFDRVLNQIVPIPGRGAQRPVQGVREAERFLKALCYPRPRPPLGGKSTREFRGDPPPLVIFEWPEILKLEGYIDRLSVRYERFDQKTLAPITLRATIDFVEETNNHIDGDTVRRRGSFRARETVTPQRIFPKPRTIAVPNNESPNATGVTARFD